MGVPERTVNWRMVLVPVVLFLGLVLSVGIRIFTERLPACARPAAIQARFSEQIEFLERLAETRSDSACPGELTQDFERQIRTLFEWERHAAAEKDLFSDAVILGAGVVESCEGATVNTEIKPYDELARSWSRTMFWPKVKEWPASSLWYVGRRQVVRYEDRVTDASGKNRGFRLILDLELLEKE